jgi:hypothetical protein
VLSLLDPANQTSLLGKPPGGLPGAGVGGTGTNGGAYEHPDDLLTRRDLLTSTGMPARDSSRVSWGAAAGKADPVRDASGHARDAAAAPHEPPADSGTDKNMQDLLDSVQRHNPVDARGWQVRPDLLAVRAQYCGPRRA